MKRVIASVLTAAALTVGTVGGFVLASASPATAQPNDCIRDAVESRGDPSGTVSLPGAIRMCVDDFRQ